MVLATLRNIFDYRRFLRLEEFDQSTETGRSNERYRRALLSSLTMFLSRVISVVIGLYTIYVAAPILGTERMAAWFAIVTFSNLAASLDFGIPSALVNRIVKARIEGDAILLQALTVGLTSVVIIGLVLTCITAGLAAILPWNWLLNNSTPELQSETRDLTILIAPTLLIQLLNGGLTNIFLGLQKAFVANVFGMFSNLASFFTIYLAVHHMPNAAGIIWAAQVTMLISSLLMFISLQRQFRPKWRISFGEFGDELKAIWNIGRGMFLINVVMAITQNLDVILASSLLDAESISALITTQRLFSIFMGAATILTTPLWAAYSDAMVRHDYDFIKITLLRSFYVVSGLIVAGFFPVIIFSNDIFSTWTGATIIPSKSLVTLSAISAGMGVFYVAFNFYLIGCQIMRPQFFSIILLFVTNCILKSAFALYFGVNGLVIGSLIAFVITFGLSYGVVFRREVFFWAYPQR